MPHEGIGERAASGPCTHENMNQFVPKAELVHASKLVKTV